MELDAETSQSNSVLSHSLLTALCLVLMAGLDRVHVHVCSSLIKLSIVWEGPKGNFASDGRYPEIRVIMLAMGVEISVDVSVMLGARTNLVLNAIDIRVTKIALPESQRTMSLYNGKLYRPSCRPARPPKPSG
jgi:hypothetical protein